jgi:hypothetical protein
MRAKAFRIPAVLAGVLAGSLVLAGGPGPLQAQVSAGVVVDRDGLRHFHLAVGDHYGVPHTRFARYPRSIRYDEIPVVHFLARQARVSPEAVIALRERGWAWIDVSLHLGLNPAIFVGHLPPRQGPPYGKAHGYWRQREARYLARLSDREIIDFVNLRLVADHYRRPVHEVIVLRDWGASYLDIHLSYRSPTTTRGRTPTTVVRSAPAPVQRRAATVPVTTMKEHPGAAGSLGRGGPPPGRGRGGGR